jgi:hypothetical protein
MKVEDFHKMSFQTFGIYRGLIEDNVDPLDVGRVRVRIFTIHSFDGVETPVDQLPWAEPAIGLAWSGGTNIYNNDYGNDKTKAIKGGRYNVGDTSIEEYSKTSLDNIRNAEFSEKREDKITNACGTGGDFVVPKRGNWVFLFFEGGNHNRPIYFAMAPMAKDWNATKNWRNIELQKKIEQIEDFKKDFKPRDQIKPKEKSWADKAIVNSLVGQPDLKVFPPDDGQKTDTNRDIQCVTSANGTTIIIDNQSGKEQIFVIHKNCLDYTDKYGNKKIYVGKQRGKNGDSSSKDKIGPTNYDIDESCHLEIGVEGNHDLHILGNYNIYTKGRTHIQCDDTIQIDSAKSIGIAIKEGDIDLIVEKGNVNADIAGNLDADIGENLNAHVLKNANILIEGNLKTTVNKQIDLISKQNINMTCVDFNLNSSGIIKINASEINTTSNILKISKDVNITGSVIIGNTLDVRSETSVGSNLWVTNNLSCGGSLKNKGSVDLGSPVMLHGVQVVGGMGSGNGKPPATPQSPTSAPKATEATKENSSLKIDKDYSSLENNDSYPFDPQENNPGSSK